MICLNVLLVLACVPATSAEFGLYSFTFAALSCAAGVAAGALEVQLPERVAHVYCLKQDPMLGQHQRSQYNTFLKYLIVDGQPVTVQVQF
jgi:uncharacterized membrane protein YhfC